jgi:hypothetical protein
MSIMSGVKAGFGALKSHWVFFLVLAIVVAGLAISQNAKRGGMIQTRLASIPLVGRFFA